MSYSGIQARGPASGTRGWLLVLALAVVGADAAAARTLHVRAWGADSEVCGGYTAPCATPTQAIENARNRERIMIGSGVYPGFQVMETKRALKVHSTAGRDAAVIQGGVEIYADGVQLGGKRKGFTVVNEDGPAVTVQGATRVLVEGIRASNSLGGIEARDTDRLTITGCTAAGNSGSGISVVDSSRTQILTVEARENAQAGFQLSGITGGNVANNVAHGNGAETDTEAPSVGFTYSYRGQPFWWVRPPYSTSNRVEITFTVNLPTNVNLPFDDYALQLVSYRISDGIQTFTHQNPPGVFFTFRFSTNATGSISEWAINAVNTRIGNALHDTIMSNNPYYHASPVDQAATDGGIGRCILRDNCVGTWIQGTFKESDGFDITATGLRIQGNVASANLGNGFEIRGSDNRLTRNVAVDNEEAGFYEATRGAAARLVRNTAAGNLGHGYWTRSGNADNARFQRNNSYGNGGCGLNIDGEGALSGLDTTANWWGEVIDNPGLISSPRICGSGPGLSRHRPTSKEAR
jgi:parallel beta-helix repeat protein